MARISEVGGRGQVVGSGGRDCSFNSIYCADMVHITHGCILSNEGVNFCCSCGVLRDNIRERERLTCTIWNFANIIMASPPSPEGGFKHNISPLVYIFSDARPTLFLTRRVAFKLSFLRGRKNCPTLFPPLR